MAAAAADVSYSVLNLLRHVAVLSKLLHNSLELMLIACCIPVCSTCCVIMVPSISAAAAALLYVNALLV
jgi:hypothetical protein